MSGLYALSTDARDAKSSSANSHATAARGISSASQTSFDNCPKTPPPANAACLDGWNLASFEGRNCICFPKTDAIRIRTPFAKKKSASGGFLKPQCSTQIGPAQRKAAESCSEFSKNTR